MKTKRKTMRHLTYLLISMCVIPSVLYGQKTLGSTIIPQKTALLELKSQEVGNDNVTSEIEGLVVSRVLPVDRKYLNPLCKQH